VIPFSIPTGGTELFHWRKIMKKQRKNNVPLGNKQERSEQEGGEDIVSPTGEKALVLHFNRIAERYNELGEKHGPIFTATSVKRFMRVAAGKEHLPFLGPEDVNDPENSCILAHQFETLGLRIDACGALIRHIRNEISESECISFYRQCLRNLLLLYKLSDCHKIKVQCDDDYQSLSTTEAYVHRAFNDALNDVRVLFPKYMEDISSALADKLRKRR
jgi:hypothetical protein